MISVSDALELINHATQPLEKVKVPLSQSQGIVLAEPMLSPINSPLFNQSAMDGYAVDWTSLMKGEALPIKGLVQAGSTEINEFEIGSAVRIYTGAPIPVGADTVIMQEHVSVNNGYLSLIEPNQFKGSHIRKIGSQIAEGELAVGAGFEINAAIAGYLAGLGIQEITAFKRPKVGIIITGKELVQAGTQLKQGQIFESNSIMLQFALAEGGFQVSTTEMVDDNPELITNAIAKTLKQCDILLLTGGVSVGDFDYVVGAVEANDAKIVFHKIKQKPGKPLLFATKDSKPIFGLPGNPGSVIHCFQSYVIPCLQKMSGRTFKTPHSELLPLNDTYSKKPGLTHFMKGLVKNGMVEIVKNQESYKLNPFTVSEVMVKIPEETTQVNMGDLVEVIWLDRLWK